MTLRGFYTFCDLDLDAIDRAADFQPCRIERIHAPKLAPEWSDCLAAEVSKTVKHGESGNLGLNARTVNDIVAFLGALTDDWKAARFSRGK